MDILKNIEDPEIAHFFWEGELTNLEISSMKSFVKNGFKVYFWNYNGLEVPGCITRDPNEIINKKNLYSFYQGFDGGRLMLNNEVTQHAHLATFADIFRTMLLCKEEGWWFDTDCFCLSNQTNFKKIKKNKSIVAGNHNYPYSKANNAVLYIAENFKSTLQLELNFLLNKAKKDESYFFGGWTSAGPNFINNLFIKYDLINTILPEHLFYAIRYEETKMFINPGDLEQSVSKLKYSMVTHSWDTWFKRNNIDKNNPPEGSLLYYLYKINNK